MYQSPSFSLRRIPVRLSSRLLPWDPNSSCFQCLTFPPWPFPFLWRLSRDWKKKDLEDVGRLVTTSIRTRKKKKSQLSEREIRGSEGMSKNIITFMNTRANEKEREASAKHASQSPPPTQSSLLFCTGVQFSRDSILLTRAFNDRIQMERGLWTVYVVACRLSTLRSFGSLGHY